jgi:hypothetical protein
MGENEMIKREKDGSVSVTFSDLEMERIERHVHETRERLSTLAADPKVTETEAERIGVPPGSSLIALPGDKLGILANRYLNERMDITLFWRVHQQYSGSESRRVMFADARLETLRRVMGDEEFDAAIVEKREEWRRTFAETDEAERNLAPCRTCGKPRVFASLSYGMDDTICSACEHEVMEAELGPCVSCGGNRELVGSAYTEGRCHDCAARECPPCKHCGGTRSPHDSGCDGGLCTACLNRQFGACSDCGRPLTSWVADFGEDICCDCAGRRREQEPCPKCGGHRDAAGSAHTGDLCWSCAEKQQPPCASCGSRLRLGRDKGDVCGRCRVNRHFNLTERPST